MSEATAITVTLEFGLQCTPKQLEDLSIILESMLQGAVSYTSVDATGLGYSYRYEKKKSRRGMVVKNQSKTSSAIPPEPQAEE